MGLTRLVLRLAQKVTDGRLDGRGCSARGGRRVGQSLQVTGVLPCARSR